MYNILSILLSVYPSTKGAEYIIAILFLVVFIIFISIFYKAKEKKSMK